MVDLPDGILGMTERDEVWAAWVDGLPRLADDLLDEWELEQDGLAQHGFTALVLPVVGAGEQGMLKISFPDDETALEHLAMRHWNGRGAARLMRADPHRNAMLLERLRFAKLDEVPVEEACAVVAGLYADLHIPAPPQLARLSTRAAEWAEVFTALPRSAPIPRRLVEQAAAVARGFAEDDATDGTLVHADLHYLNVLAADREPWLAIDPKPLSGDPHYELAPMLWNRWDEVVASGDVRGAVRRRFHSLVDAADLDEDRARRWVVFREMAMAVWHLDEPSPGGDGVTVAVSIAKAVQD